MNRPRLAAVAALVGFAALQPARADACATAPPHGVEVNVDAEEALIAWDPGTQTEQFVRRAQFSSGAKDFGFLVPTPAPPTLAEVDGSVFARLHEATRPLVVEKTELQPHFSCLTMLSRAPTQAASEGAPVRVLSIQSVAGYEAAVLQSGDAEALRTWLEGRGYAARPALTAWLAPYVAKNWTITAFKIADAGGGGHPASAAVRMTFATDRPFYPYREPADGPKSAVLDRSLRVFLVTTRRMQGTVGGGAFAGALQYARSRPGLAALLGSSVVNAPDTAWLHDFLDRSSPRPGTDDLFFAASKEQAEVVPPPTVSVRTQAFFLPIDLLMLVGAGALLVVRLTRRRSS
jgi:hypothetical protein